MANNKPIRVKIPSQSEDIIKVLRAIDTDKPKPKDVKTARKYLQEIPELAAAIGSVSYGTKQLLLDNLFGDVENSSRLAAEVHLDHMRVEFGYENSPIWEQMIIDHLLLCWLRLEHIEYRLARIHQQGEWTHVQMNHWVSRLTSAQRHFLKAVTTLARIRKLNLPAIQVNIANQQVNQVNTR